MRGLLVPALDEPEVVSRRDWNLGHTIADRLGCMAIEQVPLPIPMARHMALFISADHQLYEVMTNHSLTALLHDWSEGRQLAGTGLFVGYDATKRCFSDLGIVTMWRLAAQMVAAMHKLTV